MMFATLIAAAFSVQAGGTVVELGSRSTFPSAEAIAAVTVDIEGDQADSEFGFSVAAAGDVNGDGYSDALGNAAQNISTITAPIRLSCSD